MTTTTFFIVFIPILSILLLLINLLLAPHYPYQEKDSTFECGFHSFSGQNRTQFSISFFIFGLLFLLFDLEIILIFPFSVSAYTNGIHGLIIMLVFFILLTLGFIFELGKNALTIDSKQTSLSSSKYTHDIFSFITLDFTLLDTNYNYPEVVLSSSLNLNDLIKTFVISLPEISYSEIISSLSFFKPWDIFIFMVILIFMFINFNKKGLDFKEIIRYLETIIRTTCNKYGYNILKWIFALIYYMSIIMLIFIFLLALNYLFSLIGYNINNTNIYTIIVSYIRRMNLILFLGCLGSSLYYKSLILGFGHIRLSRYCFSIALFCLYYTFISPFFVSYIINIPFMDYIVEGSHKCLVYLKGCFIGLIGEFSKLHSINAKISSIFLYYLNVVGVLKPHFNRPIFLSIKYTQNLISIKPHYIYFNHINCVNSYGFKWVFIKNSIFNLNNLYYGGKYQNLCKNPMLPIFFNNLYKSGVVAGIFQGECLDLYFKVQYSFNKGRLTLNIITTPKKDYEISINKIILYKNENLYKDSIVKTNNSIVCNNFSGIEKDIRIDIKQDICHNNKYIPDKDISYKYISKFNPLKNIKVLTYINQLTYYSLDNFNWIYVYTVNLFRPNIFSNSDVNDSGPYRGNSDGQDPNNAYGGSDPSDSNLSDYISNPSDTNNRDGGSDPSDSNLSDYISNPSDPNDPNGGSDPSDSDPSDSDLSDYVSDPSDSDSDELSEGDNEELDKVRVISLLMGKLNNEGNKLLENINFEPQLSNRDFRKWLWNHYSNIFEKQSRMRSSTVAEVLHILDDNFDPNTHIRPNNNYITYRYNGLSDYLFDKIEVRDSLINILNRVDVDNTKIRLSRVLEPNHKFRKSFFSWLRQEYPDILDKESVKRLGVYRASEILDLLMDTVYEETAITSYHMSGNVFDKDKIILCLKDNLKEDGNKKLKDIIFAPCVKNKFYDWLRMEYPDTLPEPSRWKSFGDHRVDNVLYNLTNMNGMHDNAL